MDKSIHQFFVLLDVPGQLASLQDRELAAARALLDPDHPAFVHVKAAHDATAKIGLSLLALEQWGRPIDGVPPPNDIPGPVIGDAGSVVRGHGPVTLSAMSFANWSFVQQKNLLPKWAEIFNGSTLDEVNAAIGALPGNLTTAGEDPIVSGIDLSSF
jgi:hypothetical protein